MQEQHPYKMTPEQGWVQMKPILEKEMPVVTKSRRFLAMWWAAAAIFTSSVVASFALIDSPFRIQSQDLSSQEIKSTSNDEDLSPALITDKSSANQIVAEQENVVNSTQSNSTEDSRLSSMSNMTDNQLSTGNNLVSPNSEIKRKTQNIFSIPNSRPNEIKNIIVSVDEKSKNNSTVSLTEYVTAMIDSKDPSTTCFIKSDISAAIPTLDPIELETQSLAIGSVFPGKSSKFKRANNLLTPHLTVGAMKEFQTGLGAHGGAGLDINVSPRLSLTADIGYRVHTPDAVLFGGNSAEDKDQESFGFLRNDLAYEGIGNYLPIEVVNTASGQVISQFVETVNQWQVSAGIKYDLSRRFFVQAGATYGFGTTSRSTFPIVSNDINNIPTTGNPITVENSFDTYDVLKNTTSVTAGIGFKISPKTEVYAQWSHGLNPYLEGKGETPLVYEPHLETESGDNYIRGIDFGLRHSL